MRKNNKLFGALSIVASAIILTACSGQQENQVGEEQEKALPVEVAPVTYGVLTDSNQLTGTIEAENEVNVMPKAAGEIVNIYVEKGDIVQKGDVIAQLDDTNEQNAVKQQRTSLEQAKTSLQSAQNAKSRAQTSYEQSANSLKSAKTALEQAKQNQEDNIKNLDIQLDNAQSSWETAQKNLTRSKTLYDQGLIPLQEYESAVSTEKSAKNALEQAKLSKEQAQRESNLKAQEEAVEQAELNLEIAETSLKDAEIGVQQAQISVDQAQLNLDTTMENLDDKVIKATISGEVTDVVGEVGEMASNGSTFATIVSTDLVKLNISISSNLFNSFNVGDEVDVKVAGLEDDFKGTVTYISSVSTGYGLFSVEIEIDNSDKKIRPGMVASVIVEEIKEDNSLIIPTTAITTKESKSVVFIISDGRAVMKEVEVGLSNTEFTSVSGDLKENDQIVVSGQYLLEDGNLVEIMEED
ncbi:efflux RND transporter periplasmic adaptor subunit [Lysinibacillus telephonicus]|uniref:efflux RND transporter periplasmic adaptor subunit n=1 Tax=Lysinibacillus telephonicus TaxID=1714840 RepID=UPI003BA34B0E